MEALADSLTEGTRLSRLQTTVWCWFREHQKTLSRAGLVLLCIAVSAYLAYCIQRDITGSIPLIVFAAIFIVFGSYYLIKWRWGDDIRGKYLAPAEASVTKVWTSWGQWVWYCVLAVGLIVYLVVDIRHTPYNYVALSGLAFFVLISFIASKHPDKVPWGVVVASLGTQIVMGLIILRWPTGAVAIQWFADKLTGLINHGLVGARFVFGDSYQDHYFAMTLMPIMCYFCALTNLLYYWGVIQYLISIIGTALYFILGTSKVEVFVAVADIFLGPDSAILMVKSVVPLMSASQIHTIMACGLATIDGGLIAVFESIGVPGRHLVSASLMSAPAALAYSKILYPEPKQQQQTQNPKIKFEKSPSQSAVCAFTDGAMSAVPIIASVLAMLISFLSLLAFINTTLTWFGHRAGVENLTIELICSYVLMPMTFLMGVEWADCKEVARLIGIKTVVNEFVAYTELAELIDNREQGLQPTISVRSEAITTYALCGFSNFGTVGMLIGFLSILAPNKKAEIAGVAIRALVSSSIACFSTAAIAALLYKD